MTVSTAVGANFRSICLLRCVEGFTGETDKRMDVCCVIERCVVLRVGTCGTSKGRGYHRLSRYLKADSKNPTQRRWCIGEDCGRKWW